jgi:hypothetical protein
MMTLTEELIGDIFRIRKSAHMSMTLAKRNKYTGGRDFKTIKYKVYNDIWVDTVYEQSEHTVDSLYKDGWMCVDHKELTKYKWGRRNG